MWLLVRALLGCGVELVRIYWLGECSCDTETPLPQPSHSHLSVKGDRSIMVPCSASHMRRCSHSMHLRHYLVGIC